MSLASLEHEEVEQFTREFEALFNAGDAAGMASFYAEDARLLAEHADLIRGRDAIERFWREAISRARAADAEEMPGALRREHAPGARVEVAVRVELARAGVRHELDLGIAMAIPELTAEAAARPDVELIGLERLYRGS
jgi:hypothetical protein